MAKIDLGSSHSLKTIILLMLPAMAAQLVSVLYSIVDRIYVGNMANNGALALVGVGVAAPICTLISSFAFWVGLGGAPLFSMCLGEKRENNAKKILSNALLMLIIFSLLIGIIFFLCLKPMLYAFGASKESFPYAYEYMNIYLIGTIFSILTYGLNQFLTAQGESLWAMLTTVIACLLNVGLDPLFIYAFDMGVKGAAIATVVCQGISCLLAVFLLTHKTKIKLSFGGYDIKIMVKILKLGFSPFIITCTDSIVLIALNSVLSRFGGGNGDFYIEVATIVTAFESLVTGPLLGISSGTQPILGYNYGAKNIALIKKAEKQIAICGLVFTSVCFLASLFVAEPFARLFLSFSSKSGNEENTISTAAFYIHIYMYGIIPLSLQYVFVDGLTGMGQAKYSIWLSLNRKIVLLLSFTFLLPLWTGEATSAFYAELIADVGSGIVTSVVYFIIVPKILEKREASTENVLGENEQKIKPAN